jgi:hypothetical protein
VARHKVVEPPRRRGEACLNKKRIFGEIEMAKRSRKNHKSQANLQGFVVVAFAKDLEQAREYESLLKVNDIPVVINQESERSTGATEIAVMVPEDFLDEAHVIIESQDTYDDFCDLTVEDEEEEDEEEEVDFDGDLFDDNF